MNSVRPIHLRGRDGNASHVTSNEVFETAVATLRQHGLLQRSGVASTRVGNMHQLLQRCVRERIEKESDPLVGESGAEDAGAVAMLRAALRTQFVWDGDPQAWGKLRELAPCVAQFWKVLDKRSGGGARADGEAAGVLEATVDDGAMLIHLGELLRNADGDARERW